MRCALSPVKKKSCAETGECRVQGKKVSARSVPCLPALASFRAPQPCANACRGKCHLLLLCIPLPLTTCVTSEKRLYSPSFSLPIRKMRTMDLLHQLTVGKSNEITPENKKQSVWRHRIGAAWQLRATKI